MALYDEWSAANEYLATDFEYFKQCQKNDILMKELNPLFDRLKNLHKLQIPEMMVDDKGVYTFKPFTKNIEYQWLESEILRLLKSEPYAGNTQL